MISLLFILQIPTFSGHGQNGGKFWNCIITRENVSQCSLTSCYRIVISEFIIACASLAGYSSLTKVIPSAVLSLCEIGSFTPTQSIRDQGKKKEK